MIQNMWKKLKLRESIFLLAGTASGITFSVESEKKIQPNIIILLADDLGYNDLGIQGATDVLTPNIDEFFREGMQFKEAYVSFPTCGPSRASLLTGRHHMRIGFPTNPDNVIPTKSGNRIGLPAAEVTLADMMQHLGYATGMFGKWHLGFEKVNHPLNRGFDEFFGFLGSLRRYFDLGNSSIPKCMFCGFEKVHDRTYITDALARETADFIERRKNSPFFIYVPFNAVHTPLMYDTDPGNVSIPLNGTGDPVEDRRMLASMIEGLDRGIGTIMQKLKDCRLEENTLVFFLSDNGGPEATGVYDNGSLRGYKGTLFEGGIRVPMAARWLGKIPAGSTYNHFIRATDMFATSVSLAGGTLLTDRTYDSANLLPILTGAVTTPVYNNESFFWNAGGMQAVRRDNFKLVMRNNNVEGLYDIAANPAESENLAALYPERVSEMQQEWNTWYNAMPEPEFKKVSAEEAQAWIEENDAFRW